MNQANEKLTIEMLVAYFEKEQSLSLTLEYAYTFIPTKPLFVTGYEETYKDECVAYVNSLHDFDQILNEVIKRTSGFYTIREEHREANWKYAVENSKDNFSLFAKLKFIVESQYQQPETEAHEW